MSFTTLNNELVHASKKFARACEQIKILKQRIAELIRMFSYSSEQSQITTTANNNNNTVESPNANNNNNFNANIFKESIRQQIENLQSVKTAYFMYAHRKADEITRLQCELYGEDTVRASYENASPEVLISATSTTESQDEDDDDHEHNDQDDEHNQVQFNTQETSSSSNENTNNNWPHWNAPNQQQTAQIQLIEYDFLTA
jgi:hypothetical protein